MENVTAMANDGEKVKIVIRIHKHEVKAMMIV